MGPFAITTEAGTFEVAEWAAPVARVLRAEDRTCRLGVAWTPAGVVVDVRACPDAVASEAIQAVSRWSLAGPPGLHGRHDLGEIWFVYPFEADDTVQVLIRQDPARHLTLPEGVDALPYAIRAWRFVRYPAEVHAPDDPDVVCVIDVNADRKGVATEVHARGCADPFRRTAEEAIGGWSFVPPVVHGEPIPSAFTLSATFSPDDAVAPPQEARPDADRQRLWDDGRFDQLTRDERIWFIHASLGLLDTGLPDLGPGHVRFALPGRPDLGAREAPDWWTGEGAGRPIPPLPDHPPIFLLGRPDHLGIEVFEMPLPDPTEVDGATRGTHCELVVQVDGERRVSSWTDECDPAARKLALHTAEAWILRHDGRPVVDERVRFRATLLFDPAGATAVRLEADGVRTPLDALPTWVRTWRRPRPTRRVAPDLPRDLPLPDAECRLAVEVDASGRPDTVAVVVCPEGFERAAVRAVRRWRWRPAEEDGVPVASSTEVTIRLGG